MFEASDYALIEASFAQQYGIRLRNEEAMSWDEFITLLTGLNETTPLGKVVGIRAETNKKVIKEFTPQEKKIHNEWKRRNAKNISQEEYDKAMRQFELMFQTMALKRS